MIIKTPHFTIKAKVKGLMAEVKFCDINYVRGKFNVTYHTLNFESYNMPQYSGPSKIYLPGINSLQDEQVILVPTRLLTYLKDWIKGGKEDFLLTDEEKKVFENYNKRISLIGTYVCDKGRPVTCKEAACYNFVSSKNEEVEMSLGIKLASDKISQLRILIRHLPKEAKVKFKTEFDLTVITANSWWKDYYRIGWLLNQIRILDGRKYVLTYDTEYYQLRSSDFLRNQGNLPQWAKVYWTHARNWVTNAQEKTNKAFGL